jgi:hypothetical protein
LVGKPPITFVVQELYFVLDVWFRRSYDDTGPGVLGTEAVVGTLVVVLALKKLEKG